MVDKLINGYTTIAIQRITVERLKKKRITKTETYDEILRRIIKQINKNKKDETKNISK